MSAFIEQVQPDGSNQDQGVGQDGKDHGISAQEPLVAAIPDSEPTKCLVCNELQARIGHQVSQLSTMELLKSTIQQGCPSCSMIWKAISVFCTSIPPEHRMEFDIQKIMAVEVLPLLSGKLNLNLFFSNHGRNLMLDIYSTRSKYLPGTLSVLY